MNLISTWLNDSALPYNTSNSSIRNRIIYFCFTILYFMWSFDFCLLIPVGNMHFQTFNRRVPCKTNSNNIIRGLIFYCFSLNIRSVLFLISYSFSFYLNFTPNFIWIIINSSTSIFNKITISSIFHVFVFYPSKRTFSTILNHFSISWITFPRVFTCHSVSYFIS